MRAGLILLLGWVLCAQTPDKYPLEALQIQGNKQIPAEKIIAASGLKLGERVQKADFDAARDRLLETGAFESVGYSYKPSLNGYDTTFEVVEVETLYPYRFEALPARPTTRCAPRSGSKNRCWATTFPPRLKY